MPSSLPSKMLRHLCTHFVATLPDAGTDGSVQIFCVGAEALAHSSYGIRGDACRRATPSGVDRGHGTPAFIHQQHRNAVCGFDGYYAARLVFDQGVTFSEQPGAAFGNHARRGVDLSQRGELREGGGNIGKTRAEAVHQPRQRVEFSDSVDIFGIPIEHDLYRVLGLRDADLRLEFRQHGFIQANFGGPLDQSGHLVDLVLQFH